uniref:Alanine--glyoxylate aminotransferase 2, mitochondrial n=1 Tax=Pundamilia nyererei TaxID=303518 RepID=A0A3B4FHP0_9CICH
MYKVVSCISGQCAALTGQSSCLTSLARFRLGSGAARQKSAIKYCTVDIPEMPPCSFKPEEYKGMSKEQMMEICKQNCNPMTTKITYYKKPVFIHQGYMQWLWDVDGKRYLDLFAGVATISVGHCHPKLTAPLLRSILSSSFDCIHDAAVLLNPVTEGTDQVPVFFHLYVPNTSHNCCVLGIFLHVAYVRLIVHTMCPDVFRGPWGGSYCRDSPVQSIRQCSCAQGACIANKHYIEQLEETFATSVPSQIAAFFGEPIQGMGGAVQYPKNYLKEAYKLVRQRGGICIADETGFGRTGSHFWGFQGHDVIPDMVTMAKGIGNGFPVGAVVTTPEIAASFVKASHFNTFGGNPLACAVASSVLDTIREDSTQHNSLHVGTYLMTQMAELRDKYEIIGDVCGKGLQIGVEMVKDKGSREPLPPEAMSEILEDIKDMGVLIGKGGVYGQTFRIQPPMCITREDVDFFLAVFNKAISGYTDRK